MKRRVIQITNVNGVLYALCDDGSVWKYMSGWMKLTELPE